MKVKVDFLQIRVNGESREVPAEVSLQELLTHLTVPGDRVAIELNQRVVRRAEWTEVKLREDDRVEIVHFVGGGATFHQGLVRVQEFSWICTCF